MLRSNFEPGTTRWAVRRAQWKSMGIREADFEKPKIAVINSSSTLSSCFIHLDDVSKVVQQAIRDAGGLPFEVRTVASSDFVTSAGKKARYLMPTRDLIVNEIEVTVEGALLDGMICLSSCDKTTPAHLMAAGRLNIPTLLLTCGYQIGGLCHGKEVDIDDVYESIGAVEAGKMSLEQLTEMADAAIQTPGVCAGLGTANTMHILAEALGMTLPGNSPVLAGSRKLYEYARKSGERIVAMVQEDLRPRQILTREAFENVVTVDLALGGSVNSVRHLAAVATEAELDLQVVELFEELAKDIPLLVTVRPNGPYRTEDLEAAGGTPALMKRLADKLHLDARTSTGRTVGENLEGMEVGNPEVIRPLQKPHSLRPGIAIFRGNLAPEGSIVKLSAIASDLDRFEGPANIFDTEDEAIEALGNGKIRAGEVIVLRGMGPKGGPGTVFAASFVAALNGAGMAHEVAVLTDGELSGLNRGIVVGQIMPEAAEGGPLAVVSQGDTITIDLANRTLTMQVSEEELRSRLSAWKPEINPIQTGWLALYAQLVQPISGGAVLGKRRIKPEIGSNG
ncbi:dihydroxy-acid dehydratase [Paenibacillus sp.]|uniref:dihydroxy-acid dehydratase n=1 Tax=Paenibacillus sp. TaxID=58172 RepID=UPI002D65D2F0|nr:dihydroxy-acid dehydratase [Paenibacillus sp.]HZG56241.1 dihydroxy-acid dehydratase [Paenibacillus sp.]